MKNMSWSGKLKLNDYKSIALPTELQGRNLICRIFSLISQLNQCLKNIISVRCLLAAHADLATCSVAGTNLSVWSRYGNLFQIQISFVCFHPVIIKTNGVENYEEELKIYKSCT